MKKIRKALSVCLVLLLMMTSFPMVDIADFDIGITASALDAAGNCGENAAYTFDSETGELVISGEGKIDDLAFYGNQTISNVIIGDYITEIGADAFRFSSIESITIGKKVAKLGDCAFYGCDDLISVTLPDSVTIIGIGVFCDCDKLTSVVIPDSITVISESAFFNCKELSSVVIPDCVKAIGGSAFLGCDNLISVIIPDNVENIDECAFAECTNLVEIVIGKGVDSISNGMFYGCNNLEIIVMPNTIKTIGYQAFISCSTLQKINLPKTVTYIDDEAFRYCSSLCDVYYDGSEEDWNAISIGENNDELKNATIHFAEVPECGHANVTLVPQVDATCTESGAIEYYYCADCDGKLVLNEGCYEYLDGSEEIPSLGHGHTLGFDEISAVPATCTADGNTAGKYCKDCGEYYDGYEVIASEGHKWSENYVIKDGDYHGNQCSACGEFSDVEGHKYKIIDSTPATCVNKGTKIFKCDCGDEFLTTTPVSSEHQWGEWSETVAPTCTEKGTEIRRCTVAGCPASEEQDIDAKGHTTVFVPLADSTCQSEGTAEHYMCSACSTLFKDAEALYTITSKDLIVAKKAHIFTDYKLVKYATCTEKAVERAYCDSCATATDERSVGEVIPHEFKNYVSDGNATCIEDGTLTAICAICKTEKDTVADVGSKDKAPHSPDDAGVVCKLCNKYIGCVHTYTDVKYIIRTPTCTANGIKAIYCTKCHANKPGTEETLPATGHKWDDGEIIRTSTCSEKGLQLFRCTNFNCDAAETRELPLADHDYKEVITHATCTEDGYSTFTCTKCSASYIDKAVKAYGHMFDVYYYDEGSATCYKDGTKTSTCANACGATKTITDEGSKIDHVMTDFTVIKQADCLNDGEEEARCLYYDKCGYSELVPVDAYGHEYVYNSGYEATCTKDGRVEGASCVRCKYGADILVIPAKGHDYPIEWSELLSPDCLSKGVRIKICNSCNNLISEVIPQSGHFDEDGNSICDVCGKDVTVDELEPSDKPEEKPCDCDCHAGGIKEFFFKFINFFAKIFDKSKRTCKCGKSH